MPRWVWPVVIAIYVAAMVAFVAQFASGQTTPSFCGFASVITPPSAALAAGSGGAYASFSVTNTASAPTIPTLAAGRGSIVGALFFVTIAPINITTDGTAPNANQGGMMYGPSPAPGGASFTACGSDLTRLKWVAASTTQGNSTVFGTFFMNGR